MEFPYVLLQMQLTVLLLHKNKENRSMSKQNSLNMADLSSGLISFNQNPLQPNTISSLILTSNNNTLNITNPNGINGNPDITFNTNIPGFNFTSSDNSVQFSGINPLTPGNSITMQKPFSCDRWVILPNTTTSVQIIRNSGYTIGAGAVSQVVFTLPLSTQSQGGDVLFIATRSDNTAGFSIQQNPGDQIYFYGNTPGSTTLGTAGSVTGWTNGTTPQMGSYVLCMIFIGTFSSTNQWVVLSSSGNILLV